MVLLLLKESKNRKKSKFQCKRTSSFEKNTPACLFKYSFLNRAVREYTEQTSLAALYERQDDMLRINLFFSHKRELNQGKWLLGTASGLAEHDRGGWTVMAQNNDKKSISVVCFSVCLNITTTVLQLDLMFAQQRYVANNSSAIYLETPQYMSLWLYLEVTRKFPKAVDDFSGISH